MSWVVCRFYQLLREMGIGIHYSGRFNPAASLPKLIAEVTTFSKNLGWETMLYGRDFPSPQFEDSYSDQIYGIAVIPPDCDPLFICFLSIGRLSSPLHLESFGYSDELIHREYLYLLSINTLQAGVAVHVKLIEILKLISRYYLLDFEINDEGGYWESGDESLLAEAFYQRMQMIELSPRHHIAATWTSCESIRLYLNKVMTDLVHKQ